MSIDMLWPIIAKSFGTLMTKMGALTGVFGKFMTAIQAALSNPLTAGLALLAVGAALTLYGSKMGASASGGDAVGTFGGLSARSTPIVYTFDNRSAGGVPGAAVTPQSPITVHQTIIGPNDPQAQRQIAQLMDNAARRGLLTGSGMRTG